MQVTLLTTNNSWIRRLLDRFIKVRIKSKVIPIGTTIEMLTFSYRIKTKTFKLIDKEKQVYKELSNEDLDSRIMAFLDDYNGHVFINIYTVVYDHENYLIPTLELLRGIAKYYPVHAPYDKYTKFNMIRGCIL